jgi:membrane protein DedA with SNARE-associated domain
MTEWVSAFLEHWSYAGLLVVLLACGMGLPLPEDIPLLISGWLVHRGHARLLMMIVMGMLGVLGGDSLMFFLGRRYGESIVEHPRLAWFITPGRLEWAERQFVKRGPIILFGARFMTGARSVIYIASGIFRMPYWKFVAIDGAAALISVPVWIILGAKFGEKAEEFAGDVKTATWWILGVLVLVLAAWSVWAVRQRRRQKEQELARAAGLHASSEPGAARAEAPAGAHAAPHVAAAAHAGSARPHGEPLLKPPPPKFPAAANAPAKP